VTHIKTHLIVAGNVLYANAVDGAAPTRGVDQTADLLRVERLGRLFGDTDEAARREVTARKTVMVGPRRGKTRRGRVREAAG